MATFEVELQADRSVIKNMAKTNVNFFIMLIVFKYLNTDYCKGFANCDFGKKLICCLILIMIYQFDLKVKILY